MTYIKTILVVTMISFIVTCAQVNAEETGMTHMKMYGDDSDSGYNAGHGSMRGHEGYKGHDKEHYKRHKSHKRHNMLRDGFLSADLIKVLGLDEEQVEKIKGVQSNYLKTFIRSEAELKIAEMEFKELVSAKEVDLDKVKEKSALVGSLNSDLRFFRYKTLEDVKNLLRDDQKEHFRKLFGKYIAGNRLSK